MHYGCVRESQQVDRAHLFQSNQSEKKFYCTFEAQQSNPVVSKQLALKIL